ncbi:MAG TPA: 16S rRNA (guanine(527)-N(7))-methyltransferase RsmG [Methylomirabilota bacterium]|nr:16S rRNA (guanine(527)-N(7))-methyltransferase RsmG [Methylomirabilota bacterium]
MTAKRSSAALDALLTAIPVLLGRAPSVDEERRFARYLELLLEWDKVHDLTGLRSARDVVQGLFLDSLLFLTPMPKQRPLRVVDIGSGAGIPGLPLRIVDSGLQLTLVESRRKRISFLATARRELGLLDVDIREGRAEQIIAEAPELAGAFDCALLRGVRPTPALLSTCRAYLEPRGVVVAAGPPADRAPAPAQQGVRIAMVEHPKLAIRRLFFVAQRGES